MVTRHEDDDNDEIEGKEIRDRFITLLGISIVSTKFVGARYRLHGLVWSP